MGVTPYPLSRPPRNAFGAAFRPPLDRLTEGDLLLENQGVVLNEGTMRVRGEGEWAISGFVGHWDVQN